MGCGASKPPKPSAAEGLPLVVDKAAAEPETIASANEAMWPITRTSEQIIVIVAGGAHPTHNFWMQAMSPAVICREIGTPANWDSLVADAELELGPGGDMCVI